MLRTISNPEEVTDQQGTIVRRDIGFEFDAEEEEMET